MYIWLKNMNYICFHEWEWHFATHYYYYFHETSQAWLGLLR